VATVLLQQPPERKRALWFEAESKLCDFQYSIIRLHDAECCI